MTPQSIVGTAKRHAADHPHDGDVPDPAIVEALSVEHVIVEVAEMHYGMREKNPLRFVKFYSKRHPDRAFTILLRQIQGRQLMSRLAQTLPTQSLATSRI